MPVPTAHCTLTSRVERLTFDLRGLDPITTTTATYTADFVPRRLVLDVLRDRTAAPVQLLACASERSFSSGGASVEWCSPSHPDQPATPLSAMPVPLRAIVLAYVPDAAPLFA